MKSYQPRIFSTTCSVLTGAILVLAGCGSDSGGDSGGVSTGAVSLAVSDAPIHDAEKVCISFNSVEFQGEGERIVRTLDPAEKINLLDFQGDNAAPILVDEQLPAGDYQWIRLGIDGERGGNGGTGDSGDPAVCDGEGSYIVMNDGGVYNLYVPSGAQTGLKLNGGFNVPANGQIYLTADFDLMKSITAPPGLAPDVKLRPTIRLVEINDAGTLSVVVGNEVEVGDQKVTDESCEPAVYVFADGVTPNPIDIDDGTDTYVPDPNDPIATAMVNFLSSGGMLYDYGATVGFLLEGDYEVAFTCDGETFEPVEGKPATIVARETTGIIFFNPRGPLPP